MKQFSLVALGGTFDRFHKGHEELLKTAFLRSEKVIIGITTERLTTDKKFSHLILPYQKRKKEVAAYLKKQNLLEKSRIIPLYDPYGPLLKNAQIEAVVVGPRADKKVLQNLKGKIKIVHCKTIKSEDNHYLSSTRIRKGEVSRKGLLYLKEKGPFFLPFFLRIKLREPLGKLTNTHCNTCSFRHPEFISGSHSNYYGMLKQVQHDSKLIVSVGDASTRFLNSKKVKIDLAIVDFKIQRKKVIDSFSGLGFGKEKDLSCTSRCGVSLQHYRITNAQNSPGTISASLVENIKTSLDRLVKNKKREIIKIDGEDDLAVIPVVLYAPLETLIFYGQPGQHSTSNKSNKGLVVVRVTEEKKEEMKKLLAKFTP